LIPWSTRLLEAKYKWIAATDVLYMDSAVAGEAAGIAMGLLCCGAQEESTDRRAAEMLTYARETAHEKIIRGVAIGLAMACYGREENADGMVEQLTRDSVCLRLPWYLTLLQQEHPRLLTDNSSCKRASSATL
jgi:hypothetical protein